MPNIPPATTILADSGFQGVRHPGICLPFKGTRWRQLNGSRQWKAFLREIVQGVKPHAVAIDATNERFWCAEVREELGAATSVLLMVSSENTEYMGETMKVKSYLGTLAVNTFEDRSVALPNHPQIKNDMRLVRRVRGGFDNAVDSAGNHGDTFDAYKLSVHAIHDDTGPVEAHPVDTRRSQKTYTQSANAYTEYAPEDEDEKQDEGVWG